MPWRKTATVLLMAALSLDLLLLMLDGLRREGDRARKPRAGLIGLPLLMAAWANSHGGFVPGRRSSCCTWRRRR